ncbi:MAG: hypothetical protein L6Q37_06135 [Bdellovibrionaceae bacterium]|nr:hypothetical protein [Pseudobdellovibrionaceae bacterium]
MAKKKKIESEKIETLQDTSSEGLETVSIKDLENLDIFTEESAFLNDQVKSEFEALFEPPMRTLMLLKSLRVSMMLKF